MGKKLIAAVLAVLFAVVAFVPQTVVAADKVSAAVTAAFCSDKGVPTYKELATYLSGKIGAPMEIVSGMAYNTVIKMFQANKIQVGFVCGYSYTLKRDEANLEVLASPVMADAKYKGQPKYISYVIVPIDSTAKTFADLKGKSFLFSDAQSNSGYNVPRAELAKMGYTVTKFFKEVKFSGGHEKSIEMVANKQTDGASVDSLVWDYDNVYTPEFTAKTKIIAEQFAGGIPPVVVTKAMDAKTKAALKDALLKMSSDPEGKKILDKLLVSKFVAGSDANYDDIRANEKLGLDFEKKSK